MWEVNERKIIKAYASGWFPVDVISIVPFEFVAPLFMSGDSLEQNVKMIGLIRLLKLLKLLKVRARIFKILSKFVDIQHV